jgi:DNA-directed RNA polymerase specialized sigma24 family protein
MIEMLYREHSPALVLFALALTGERSHAQDAVHKVFLKLLERGMRSALATLSQEDIKL